MTDKQLKRKYQKAERLADELRSTLNEIVDELSYRKDDEGADYTQSLAMDADHISLHAEHQKTIY